MLFFFARVSIKYRRELIDQSPYHDSPVLIDLVHNLEVVLFVVQPLLGLLSFGLASPLVRPRACLFSSWLEPLVVEKELRLAGDGPRRHLVRGFATLLHRECLGGRLLLTGLVSQRVHNQRHSSRYDSSQS